jgi:molybdopterin-guanine dinucleotide biosynthesis protein A
MNQPVDRLSVQPFVLAGGLSSRFGSDKSRLVVEGKSQLQNLAESLEADIACRPIAILRHDSGVRLDYEPAITDLQISQGPLCGIATALACQLSALQTGQCDRPWALLVTCDHFAWSSTITDELLTTLNQSGRALIAAFEVDQRLHPFPSLWHCNLAEQVALAAASEDRSVVKFMQQTNRLATERMNDQGQLASFNTKEELANLRRQGSS